MKPDVETFPTPQTSDHIQEIFISKKKPSEQKRFTGHKRISFTEFINIFHGMKEEREEHRLGKIWSKQRTKRK